MAVLLKETVRRFMMDSSSNPVVPVREADVAIVILNYNGLKFLAACLKSIALQTVRPKEVIVVDNNSTDGSWMAVTAEHTLIRNHENVGFARANNQGARTASAQHVFFLNNDTQLHPTCIENLQKHLGTSMVALQQRSYDGAAVLNCGVTVDVLGYSVGHVPGREPFYADGAALAVKRHDFLEMGGFDESMFLFAEDVDLSWRWRLLGGRIECAEDAIVYHFSGGTLPGGFAHAGKTYRTSVFRRYNTERNTLRCLLKNYSMSTLCVILPLFFATWILESTYLLIRGETKVAAAYIRAIKDNVSHLRDTIAARRVIQKRRVTPDHVIMSLMYWGWAKLRVFRRIGWPSFDG